MCDFDLFSMIQSHIMYMCILSYDFLLQENPKLQEQTEELREFYDPDTVELMNWIK